MALLFLDFDGVLHPQIDGEATPADLLFCHLPRLERVLRDFPSIEIVISSTWRYHFTLEKIRARFAPDIQPRIVDTTLLVAQLDGYLSAQREQEILDWLSAKGRMAESWIALDDAAWQFRHYTERLIACRWYEGFDAMAEQNLREKLAEMIKSNIG